VQEPRKATDVLLEIESKVNKLLAIINSQDLNIKVLSNKLSEAISLLNKQQVSPSKIIVEAVQNTLPLSDGSFAQVSGNDLERNISVTAESKLPQDNSPQGFRRNSRPETYAGDNAYLPHAVEGTKSHEQPSKAPLPNQKAPPPPGRTGSEVLDQAPQPSNKKTPKQSQVPMTTPVPMPTSSQGQIPVMQRCVDKNGKSIFLADVEISDISTNKSIFKTRTTGTGKWMASLSTGSYHVSITKRSSSIKDKIEAKQDIQVDGNVSPLELPMLIIK
jgi:hypothetical protein